MQQESGRVGGRNHLEVAQLVTDLLCRKPLPTHLAVLQVGMHAKRLAHDSFTARAAYC